MTGWPALCALVFLLGLKHGFDADHLAAIDGLTRFNARKGRGFARYCGALFSLGHGVVVLAIAAFAAFASTHWQAPAWLELGGAAISIFFLGLLGLLNLRALFTAPASRPFSPVGLRSRWFSRLTRAGHPLAVAGVGTLFAISFDTISQSALFAALAGQFGGPVRAVLLGLLFVLGMLVTDGINGMWVSRLIARADRIAILASRVMGFAVAGVALLVAGLGIARLGMPAVENWSSGKELALGTMVCAILWFAYLLSRALGMRSAAAEEPRPRPPLYL